MITKQTSLYEILIRFNEAGFQGAHVIDREEVIEDGNVLSARELPARAISADEVAIHLGAQEAKLVQSADGARAERDAAVSAKAESDHALEEAKRMIAALETQRDSLFADIGRIRKARANRPDRVRPTVKKAKPLN